MKLKVNILVVLSLAIFVAGCDAFTKTEFDYYPIPSVYLQPCSVYKEREIETIRDLILDREGLKLCVEEHEQDKKAIEDIIKGP